MEVVIVILLSVIIVLGLYVIFFVKDSFVRKITDSKQKVSNTISALRNKKGFYSDRLDWEMLIFDGVACLERYDTIAKEPSREYPKVAWGITAFLSYSNMGDKSGWSYLTLRKDQECIDLYEIFNDYFNRTFPQFVNKHKSEIPFPSEQKSESELLKDYLEKEKEYLKQSRMFFKKYRAYEKDLIAEIKIAVSEYFKWIKATQLRIISNEQKN